MKDHYLTKQKKFEHEKVILSRRGCIDYRGIRIYCYSFAGLETSILYCEIKAKILQENLRAKRYHQF
jgi:hypothetical protein